MSEMNLSTEFISQAISHLSENTPRIRKCLEQLTDEQVWQKPNASSNSIGNLILHLCGNMTQYILSGLGGKPDHRIRAEEFSATGGYTREQLMTKMESTVNAVNDVIQSLSEKELAQEKTVQGFRMSGIGIIIHVVEHYSYHTGQIAFWTKLLLDTDLGFYAGIDLNRKNR